jgi:hypothetical protein
MIGVLAALLLFFLCLGGSGIFLYNQFLAGRQESPAAGSSTRESPTAPVQKTDPTATQEQPRATATVEVPTQTPEANTSGPANYQFQIERRGEDKGYFILTNTGTTDIPANQLSLRVGKSQTSGAAWGVGQLAPGDCLLARKDDKKSTGLPVDISCNPAGQTVSVPKPQEGIFKEKIAVFLENQQVGTCEKDQLICAFSFSNE